MSYELRSRKRKEDFTTREHREEIGTRMTRKERIRTDREFLGIKTVVQTFLFETIWNRARDFYKNAQTTRRKEEMASASADTKNAEF